MSRSASSRCAEEVAHVVQRGRVQVVHAADDGVVVRMVGRIQQALHPLVPVAVRRVVHPLAPLVLHHLALVVERLLRQRGEKEAQAVGLQPQPQLQVAGGERGVVVGAVQPGAGVDGAAHALHQRDVLRAGGVLRALEHHVLEQVGQPRAPRQLVSAPHVVPQVQRDDGERAILRQHHAQPVVQCVSFDRDLHPVRFPVPVFCPAARIAPGAVRPRERANDDVAAVKSQSPPARTREGAVPRERLSRSRRGSAPTAPAAGRREG
jgi:hypothetical protein